MGLEPEGKEPRRRRPRLIWVTLGAVLVAAAGSATWLWTKGASTESAPAATSPVATARVERGTISPTNSWDGTLDHGVPFTVTSSAEGTITRLVDQGQAVERGNELYRVNEQPVTLLYGRVPMYRDVRPGDSGVDVEQLETNLAELGYGGFTVDSEYTWSTAEAVRAWQGGIGAEQTGTVALGDVVFVPAAGQVDALRADVGDVVAPGTAILDITGTDQIVNLDVDVDDRNRFDVGTAVTVVLPGGAEVAGTVSTMGVVDVPSDSGEGSEGGATDSESLAQVEITLGDQVADDLIGAPVEVIVAIGDERTDVLLVPVNALLALAEGGYGLEVVRDDGTTKVVAVDTGVFAGGKVEVEGDGITEGTIVGVAGR
ncbi:MAG: efflux RND transporter periplasmic adaptor subunit [Acidimicrobiia bacterium]